MAVTFVGKASATNSTPQIILTIPATAQIGDIALLFAGASKTPYAGEPIYYSPPSGWTVLSKERGGANANGVVWYRWLQAGDPGSTVTINNTQGSASGYAYLGQMVVYRGALTVATAGTSYGGDAASITLSGTAPAGDLVGFWCESGDEYFAIPEDDLQLPSPWVERDDIGQRRNDWAIRSATGSRAHGGGSYSSTATGGTSGSPWVAIGAALGSNVAPNAPALVSPVDGAGLDRNSTNRFDWDFSDPDAGDSQSKYDLRYRVAGAATWTDVTGTTPNTYWDAPAGTFAAGDYEWQVRTYDAQGVVGPYSSSSFFTAGDAPAMPTITSPVNGGTFAQTQTVEWSTPVQDSYQIQARDTGDVVVYDSGEVVNDTARSAEVPFPDNGTTRKLRLRVKDGGLWSPWYEITGTVSWLAPPAPSFTLLADDANGALGVSIVNPAPTGAEPAAVYNDVTVDDGDGFETKYGSRQIAPNGTWTYWQPVGGRDYSGSIRVTAVADNGVTSSS